jgi:hypothetical protein
MSETDVWTNDRRVDGCVVEQGPSGWMIVPNDNRFPLTLCPCCDKPFPTAGVARRVADVVFPIEGAR